MALIAALDEPVDSAVVGRAVLVSGWAVADTGAPPAISVCADGGPDQPLYRGRPRPDVEAAYPGSGSGSGFVGLLLLDGLDSPVDVEVTVRSVEGDAAERFVRRVTARSDGATRSTSEFDTALLNWLTTPTQEEQAWPRWTVGAEQLRLALGLEGAFPRAGGEQRYSFLEWLYHLWKNEGEDALPLALVAASWLPPSQRTTLHLPRAWRDSTWGHLMVPWLDDDAADPDPTRPPLSRARAIATVGLDPRHALALRPVLPRASWPPAQRPRGINVVGHLEAHSGLGEATRCTLRTVIAAGVPHDALDLGPISADNDMRIGPQQGAPYAISVVHDNVTRVPVTARLLGTRFLRDRYSVGYWYWEAADPPQATAEASALVDEVWVASQFVADALRRASTVPVRVVPPAIDMKPATGVARERFGLPSSATCFLTMASVYSVTERKNPFGTLEAFRKAFGHSRTTEAVLVMKLTGISGTPGLREELMARIGSLPVIVIDEPLSRADVRALIAACDVVVSLHRAEGFGLPLAEAMAAGRAIIATGWSGNADFTTPETAFIVPYEIIELDRDFGPYLRGMHWAEPDVDAAASWMRLAVEDVTRRQLVADAGRAFVRARYDATVTASVLRAHLERITADSS
jgi:glycosyltransferase involved in cell wall biosynthesis